jgi:anti-sigma B factor antagonist
VASSDSDQLNSMRSICEPLPFRVSVAAGPPVLITVSGELDLASVPALEAALAHVDFDYAHHVVLDLDQLEFIDAAGLRTVLALHATCIETSSSLTITPGPRQVQRVFELTGTDRQLPFAVA